MALVDATFKWLAENVRDKIDFVVWTGDSARHDSDEEIPRTAEQILHTNTYIAEKFEQVFGNGGANHNPSDMDIPVVPTFGNNDFMPHNILLAGPNKWLNTYTSLWRKFIPEAQRHGFQRGGWFYVEVIPNKLAVFSLNSMYFFSNNAGVDGCASRYEPGYEHMEWLRVQLQLMRERGMKVILEGHVGPAKTPSKQLWDETCWQKYTLWLQQYRDVVITGLYGHMNIDHFMLQDTREVNIQGFHGLSEEVREYLGDELTINSAGDYLEELRTYWSSLPDPSVAFEEGDAEKADSSEKSKKGKKTARERERARQDALKKIGGKWAERFQLSIVGPSVVPNYFPTVRVFEYNITGLDTTNTWASQMAVQNHESGAWNDELKHDDIMEKYEYFSAQDAKSSDKAIKAANIGNEGPEWYEDFEIQMRKHKKKKGKKEKKPVDPDLHIPLPPTPGTPPGPAYSPQPLTLTGYTQYYANLTEINDDMTDSIGNEDAVSEAVEAGGWHPGRNKDKKFKAPGEPHAAKFHYEVEYSTFNDTDGYNLDDLTVRSYLRLAHKIGRYKDVGKKGFHSSGEDDEDAEETAFHRLQDVFKGYVDIVSDMFDATDAPHPHRDAAAISHLSPPSHSGDDNLENIDSVKKRRRHRAKHNKAKNRHGRNRNKAWRTFLRRAFVGILDDEDIEKFEVEIKMRAEEKVEREIQEVERGERGEL